MDHAISPSGLARDEFEDAIRRFEDAWNGPSPPEIGAHLPGVAGREALLAELVHVDLEYRLRAGESARVEEYLARYPELADDPAVVLELIVAEHGLRRRREPGVDLGEFLRRFPRYRAELPGLIARTEVGSGDGSLLRAGRHPEPLPEIDGYEVLGLLGRGGMGVVYEARQIGLGRTVALKMVSAGFHAGPKELARLRAEAAALARLQHPNIVQIFDVGEASGRPYFAFEFVAGGSLAQYLRGTPRPARAAARFVDTLARAVHAAHDRGVIHRDLKPANILLGGERGRPGDEAEALRPLASLVPKIADFGLAKCTDDRATASPRGATLTGDLVGTPCYMAPEQAMASRQPIGPAADVYALGAILYELLTGRPPFRGETPLATVLQVLENEPVSVTSLRPDVPRDLETICLKCLHKEPGRRYASAMELAEDLRRFLGDEPIRARPVGAAEGLWRWVRRHPALAGLLAAGLLAPAVALITLSLLSTRLVRSIALESAAQQAELLEEATTEFSRNAQRVEKAGFTVNKMVPPTPGTVPLSIPATFLHDVGRELERTGRTGVKVHQYSDYPFPWRTDGGPRDDFERDALRQLRQNKGQAAVHQFAELGGQRVVRYARARIMQRSCVECHGTHDKSPRRDWKVGDVRGVLEIIRPLDSDEARVSQALRLALLVSVVVSALLLGASTFLFWSGRGRRTSPGL